MMEGDDVLRHFVAKRYAWDDALLHNLLIEVGAISAYASDLGRGKHIGG